MFSESGRVPVPGGELHFESAGAGAPVVFLHGFGLDSRMWETQFQALATDFRLIRYDIRGFGLSSVPSAAAYAHEDDLQSLLVHLDALPAHVVGLSMGGQFALRFAAAYPQSVVSLVLADSALDGHAWTPDWRARWSLMGKTARDGRLSEAKAQWLDHPLFRPARAHLSISALLAQMVDDYSGWHWLYKDTARVPDPPLATRLAEIIAPCLVVTGSLDLPDFQAVAEVLAQNIDKAQRVVIDGSGHMVNLEAPQAFNAALVSFWRGLRRDG